MLIDENQIKRYALKLTCMIKTADQFRKLSTDQTFQVCCIIFPVDCSNILSIGYNGSPCGFPHERPSVPHGTEGGSGMCHAEMNALTKLNTQSCPPSILFVHSTPCSRCAGQIINSRKVIGVIHEGDYYGDKGLGRDMLSKTSWIKTVHRTYIRRALDEGKIDPNGSMRYWLRKSKEMYN